MRTASTPSQMPGALCKNMKCPICNIEMKCIDVAPCYDCGHSNNELKELSDGGHEYHKFSIFGEEIILCDFCDADFGSYYPDFFGLSGKVPADAQYELELIDKITNPTPIKDFYCEDCKHRYAFLNFIKKAREYNSKHN